MTAEESNLLLLLARRVERLQEEYKSAAPAVIRESELRLIIDASNKLLELHQ